MSNSLITVTLKLFAAYQEAYGTSELNLNIPENSSVKVILDQIIQEHPHLEKWRDVTRFGINCHFVNSDTILKQGDEIVLIPPVSGG